MPNLLASDVVVQEESPAVRGIPSLATAVLGLAGITQKGPTDQQVLANGYDEWERVFGGHIAASYSSLAVKMFFEQGGTELHFVRVVHHTTSSDPTTKTSTAATLALATDNVAATAASVTGSNTGPWNLEPGDTLIVSVDADVPASPDTVTFTATAAARETTNTSATPFALADADVLTVKIDGGSVQSITFLTANFADITNATAPEVVAVLNAYFAANGIGAHASVTNTNHVSITSNKRGTGSHVEVTGGTANAAGKLNFATAVVDGTGNVANIDAVTFSEAQTIIQAATDATVTSVGGALKLSSGTTGTSSKILVAASSTSDDEFGLDNATHTGTASGAVSTLTIDAKYDGTYANNVSVIIAAATSGEASRFNLKVSSSGTVVETFPNLSMDPTDARYVETVVNASGTGSTYIKVTDLLAAVTAPGNNPLAGTFGPLTGGGDGLASLADTDYSGGTGLNGSVGLRCLDEVQNLNLLIVPGRATASVHNAMITYCEIVREGLCFTVLDPPLNQTAEQMVSYVKTTAAIQRLSEFAAIYWPNILIDNPSKAIFGNSDTIVAPPSGAIAGLYARIDQSVPSGVFVHPAGIDNGKLFNVRGLEMPEVKKKAKRELVFPELINPISTEPGQPIFVDGARTLKDNGNWPTIGERRGVIFLEASLKQGLAFMRHRNINDRLYNEGKKTAQAFMLQQTRNEAFASTDPGLAFVLDFGKGLNPASVKFARQVVARLSVATSAPGEFVILKVSPDRRALEAELAAA